MSHIRINIEVTNSNVVKAVAVAKEEEVKPAVREQSPSPYSVKGMKKVVQDAKGVEDMLLKRDEEQQKILNDL